MVDVKPIGMIVEKWATRASAAGQEYAQQAAANANKYAANAGQAGPTYTQGVTEAIGRNAYAQGVAKAGAAKYSQGIQQKGSTRYAGGVAAGKGNYNQGIQGVISTLQGVALPPRGPRGSPGNIQRVAAIANALRAAKVGGAGA